MHFGWPPAGSISLNAVPVGINTRKGEQMSASEPNRWAPSQTIIAGQASVAAVAATCRANAAGAEAWRLAVRRWPGARLKAGSADRWLAWQQRHGVVDDEAELGLGVAGTARREDVRVAAPDAQTLPALVGRLPAQGKIELLLVGQRGVGRWIDGVPPPNKKGGGGHILETDLIQFKGGAQSGRLFAGVVEGQLLQVGVVGFGSQREIDGILIARG